MSSAVDNEYLGGHGFSHGDNDEVEAEYDRLRGLARQEAQARGECFQRSQDAYNDGDGAAAKELSNEGKEHGAQMAEYNRQASEFIFRENNAPGRVESDEIDLHGQFVEEAEDILLERIKACQERGEDHIHVIVGRGIHSAHHVQKIKPAVEKVCDQLGLQHRVEPNAGRIYVNLTGGPAEPIDEGAGEEHQQQYRSPEAPQARPQEHTGAEQQGESSSDGGFCKACCVVM
ncbi:histone methyltransferase set2 [Ascosphaera pollenicola]|nr:histone methyltransferase set2 [Ascosphaera pollenicola]